MGNIPNNDTLNGRRIRFGVGVPDAPASGPDYNHGGRVVCAPGDLGTIEQGFDNWNGVADLTIYYVKFDRGTTTHLGASEFDLLPETTPTETRDYSMRGNATAGNNRKVHMVQYKTATHFHTECGTDTPLRPQTTQDQLPKCVRCFGPF